MRLKKVKNSMDESNSTEELQSSEITDVLENATVEEADTVSEAEEELLPHEEMPLDEEQLDEVVRKEGDKWVLRNHDDTKTLGTHDTEAEAEAQETAINISKARKAGHKIPESNRNPRNMDKLKSVSEGIRKDAPRPNAAPKVNRRPSITENEQPRVLTGGNLLESLVIELAAQNSELKRFNETIINEMKDLTTKVIEMLDRPIEPKIVIMQPDSTKVITKTIERDENNLIRTVVEKVEDIPNNGKGD
jgi:hypothetical protein